ncbi:SET and MYND domain-containing protein 4 [Trachymyrmex septentrionalis]|uniref:Protein-lysine N-methyltransferase SMYD4 n=1 Tax=Trachymyrmex septentrionalis TaxID=34720 RepID=A0A195FLN3_9HYME|nr:SET and MYND domain-containing protein 4 [Trachymyrmex septentrionalis]
MDWYKVTDTLNCMLKSSRLNDEIKNMKYENELISRLLHNQEVMKFVSYWLKDLYNTKNERKQQKNLDKSTAFKLSGNKEFQSKKYAASLESYTNSARYAPSSSINLSIAIANRSASLFYMDRWQDCINDINLAIKLGYPENLRYKLHLRAAQCYLKLGNKTLVVETVLQLHSIVNEPNISNETKGKQINDIILKISCMEENADSTTDTAEFPSLPEVAFGENPNFRFASAAVEIKCTPEKGRYVVANRDIKRGQILFVEKAFAFVPLCHIKPDNCYNCCRSSGNTPVPCTECVDSIYCNITCWDEARSSYHHWECLGNQMGLWAEIGIAYLAVRMLFKCTTATDDNRLNEVQKHVLQLISNGHAITKIKAVVNNTCYNKNKVFIQQEDRIATAIYPSASMMNHSCDPNIINSFLGQFLITKATRDIAAGEEVFNCYGADFRRMLRKDRQEKMESQYCFKCNCAACNAPEYEDILKKFTAKKCPECSGPLNDNCSVLYRSSMHCMDCGTAVYENIYDFTLRQAQHYFEKAEICIENENYDEALDKLKKCLRLRKDALYKYHDDIADTMDFIAKVYAIIGQWLNSISYLEHNIVTIEEKYGSWSIEVCNEINKLTDICLEYLQEESNTSSKFYKNTLKKTRRYLNRAQEIIDFTYGPWNEAYQEIAVKKEILSSILKNFNV